MSFEPGMEKFLESFALSEGLQLKLPGIQLRKTREEVALWCQIAKAREAKKPMRKLPPTEEDAGKVVKSVHYANGSSYRGQWLNAQRHGEGQYICQSKGFLYRGQWKKDSIDGQGSIFRRMSDKSWVLSYIGQYKKGLRHGWGIFRKSPDEFYEGFWQRGQRQGWGRHFATNGAIYEGHWHADKRSGYGCTREDSGNHHVGEYKEDLKDGPGKYNFIHTGKCYRGIWRNDIPVLGEIVQLEKYKASFPHRYPMPECGMKEAKAIFDAGDLFPNSAVSAFPCTDSNGSGFTEDFTARVQETPSSEDLDSVIQTNQDMDLRQIESEGKGITDQYLAARTGDFLLSMEFLWRCTKDRTQPRPLHLRKLLAKNSQQLKALTD